MLTFAMRVVGLGYAMVVAPFAIYATQPFAADYIAIIVGFVLLFGGMGLACVLWAGARRGPWFWIVSVVPGILALLFNAFYGPYGLTHPSDTLTFVTTVLALAGGILIVVGSLTAWVEVRRGRSLWASDGRAGLVAVGVVGLVAGACLTSALAASSTSAGTAIDQPPGIDGFAHGQGHEVPGNRSGGDDQARWWGSTSRTGTPTPTPSTSIPSGSTSRCRRPRRPSSRSSRPAPGRSKFYCAVPGHRDAGMVGSIAVK